MRRRKPVPPGITPPVARPVYVAPPGRFRAPFPGGYQPYPPAEPASAAAQPEPPNRPIKEVRKLRGRRARQARPDNVVELVPPTAEPDPAPVRRFRERLDELLGDQAAAKVHPNGNRADVDREIAQTWAEVTDLAAAEVDDLAGHGGEGGDVSPVTQRRRRRRRSAPDAPTELIAQPVEHPTEPMTIADSPEATLDEATPSQRRQLRRRPRRSDPLPSSLETDTELSAQALPAEPADEAEVAGDAAGITDPFAGYTVAQLRRILPQTWGRKLPHAGRAAHVGRMLEYQATTTQACGLYPFLAGSGAPTDGVPMGRHLLSAEAVCYDPIAWLVNGLTTNPGLFLLGEPGSGKSSFVKRLTRGMAGYGIIPIFAGDVKPDYSGVVERLGGTVIRVGRGLDRINPLDTGALGEAAAAMTGTGREQLLAEVRGRRLNALLALLSLSRDYKISNGEESVLGVVLDILDAGLKGKTGPESHPTAPQVLTILRSREQLDRLMQAADVQTEAEFINYTRDLRQTLNHLCEGSLKGVFDGPTTRPIDLKAPAISLDISQVSAAGDMIVGAAMLSTWANVFAVIDGAHALYEVGKGPRRRYAVVLDELWLACSAGGSGVIGYMDALTRVNRAKGVADIRITHTLRDLEAVGSQADRAKAEGFVERASVVAMAALSKRELREVARLVPLTEAEIDMVASWSNPESFLAGAKHPGRGLYMLKPGSAPGIPIQLHYVGDEAELYNTDARIIDEVML